MHILRVFIPGTYENPLTEAGRARSIAACLVAQGNVAEIGHGEMRRDVLTALMSPSAVNYWLNSKGWFEKSRKIGSIQLVRLTDDGIRTCNNSIAGGSDVPTTRELVETKRRQMLEGGSGLSEKLFKDLRGAT